MYLKEIEITVADLRELYLSGQWDIEIDTPDGFQPVIQWFDKGKLPMVRVEAQAHDGNVYVTRCAYNHLIEGVNGDWRPASECQQGMIVLTQGGPATVVNFETLEDEECFDFEVGHPKHRYWGDGFSSHNSGKSYIVSGNIVRAAQAQGVFPIVLDSEGGLHAKFMKNLGVSIDPNDIYKAPVHLIDEVATCITSAMDMWRADNATLARDEQAKMLFIVDSLGFLSTPTEKEQFSKGDMKGDMGRKARQLKALVTQCVAQFDAVEVGMVCTNHTYKSQNQFAPDDVISGGGGFIFASNILVSMNKLKLKDKVEGDDGKKTKVIGIRAKCQVAKSRFAKPNEDCEIEIPYETGMDKFSGVFDWFKSQGVLKKAGTRWEYVTDDGEVVTKFEKEYSNELLMLMMNEHEAREEKRGVEVGVDQTPEEYKDEA